MARYAARQEALLAPKARTNISLPTWRKDIATDWRRLQFAPKEARADRKVVAAAVKQDGDALEFAEAQLQEDPSLVMAAVRSRGQALRHARGDARQDREVVLAAVEQDWQALELAPETCRCDREILGAAVRGSGQALRFASEELRGDRELVLAAVNDHPAALDWAAPALKSDRDLVFQAMQTNWKVLLSAPQELCSDRELLLLAVKQSDSAMGFASAELAADRGFLLEAVRSNAASFGYAPLELRGDAAVVLEAAKEDPVVLEHAADALRASPAFALRVLEEMGAESLRRLPKEVYADRSVLREALRRDWRVLRAIPQELYAVDLRGQWRYTDDIEVFEGSEEEFIVEFLEGKLPSEPLRVRFLYNGQPTNSVNSCRVEGRHVVVEERDVGILNIYAGDLSSDNREVTGELQCLEAADGNTFSQGDSGRFKMRRLKYAPPLLMEDPATDPELLLEAVAQDWHALELAKGALRAHRGLLLAAVRQSWQAIELADAGVVLDLAQDRQLLLEAARKHRAARELQCLPDEALLQEVQGIEGAGQGQVPLECLLRAWR